MESVDTHLVAEELTVMYSDNELDKKNIAVVSAGRGAEHARIGVLNFSYYDWRRGAVRIKQAGRGGIGRVLRDKKIKALVVKHDPKVPAWEIQKSKVEEFITPETIVPQTAPEETAEIVSIIGRWNADPDFVIEMMQDIQDRFRYISKTAIELMNKHTKTPQAYLYHIATFYKSFSLQPRGETVIQVCKGTACHVRGATNILASFERELGIREGETTPDMKYSLEAVRCLGACSIAPVVKIGEDVFGKVKARDVGKIIKQYEAGKTGPEISGEKTAAGNLKPVVSADLEKIAAEKNAELSKYKGMIMVCTGTACVSSHGFSIFEKLKETIHAKGLSNDYLVVGTGCHGFCSVGPIVVVQPDGIFYQKVTLEDVPEIVESHLERGKIVEKLLYRDPVSGKTAYNLDHIGFFNKQQLIALRNKGLVDPEDIDSYIARVGYRALSGILEMDPDEIITKVTAAGIRGRGGGGFPTGIKWSSCREAAKEKKEKPYLVCNADEGDPGAYMDRSIIETDPHSVIEGMIIGARAIGANEGFIYIRKEYPLALERLKKAILQARGRGILGEGILGKDFSFDITIHRGAGAFVCGESSALMVSMSGRAGEPSAKYIHSVESGYRDKPTVLNNVETWANIPVIIDRGPEWFSSIGSGDVSSDPWNGSSGTKVFSLVGDVNNTGLVEIPMGITLREIIFEIGGGIPGGRAFKAVQTGGPSGGCIPADRLDMKIDFDSLEEAGSMMGSGGMIVMDDKTCMVDIAKYFIDFLLDESCGKCTPCREGLFALSNILGRICRGEGNMSDLGLMEEIGETMAETSLCELGKTGANPVLSTLKFFRDEYEAHIRDKVCPAGVCKELITYSINDNCTGCTLCAKNCPVHAISGNPKELHTIDTDLCIKCGICSESCNFDAVEVK